MLESPILVKTHDFLLWLIPQTLKFPKSQRFVLAQRLNGSALTFYELLIRARKVRPNRSLLVDADVELEGVRLYLRLAHELRLLSGGQYEHTNIEGKSFRLGGRSSPFLEEVLFGAARNRVLLPVLLS